MSTVGTLPAASRAALARQASQQHNRQKRAEAAARAREARREHALKVMDSSITVCRKCDRRIFPMIPGHDCRRPLTL